MFQTDRICVWILIVSFTLLIPSSVFVKFADELCAYTLGMLAIIDCIVNGRWRRYHLLWIIIAVIGLYAVYSMVFMGYNTKTAIMKDLVIEIKPFIPFAVFLAIGPTLNNKDKALLRIIAIVNASICSILLIFGNSVIKATVGHITYIGNNIFLSMIVYLYCSATGNGSFSKSQLTTCLIYLTIGLACTRSKYYGLYVLVVFFLFFYRVGMLKHLNIKHLIGAGLVCVLVVAVAWNKIDYYFISGANGSFDPEVLESFARPVLYATGGMIFIDHIPLGSGLASFASFASAKPYSGLYVDYGIDKVYGLSESKPDFICDAFYPSLAQFGIVGVVLFIWFWVYLYSYLRQYIRQNPTKGKAMFTIGSLLICFILIECIASTVFTQSQGMVSMMFLGLLCASSPKNAETVCNGNTKRQIIS